jgi:hypothetical protein
VPVQVFSAAKAWLVTCTPSSGRFSRRADVIIPLAIAVILLTAILHGSNQTCERVFRLLRWIANRAEPPAPARDEEVGLVD